MSGMTAEGFKKSPWCKSGNNCDICRSPGQICDNIRAKWPDLDCEKWHEKAKENPQSFSTLDLHLSDRCNFGCSFCYAKNCAGIVPNVALQKQALDWFIGQAKASTITVNFYGGEPLLEFETIKELVAYAKKYSRNIHWCIVSNLSLLDPAKMAWIKSHALTISPSIDGCRSAQDCGRIFKDGRSSADIVFAAAKLLNQSQKNCSVRATISPESAPYLLESVKHLSALGFKKVTAVPASGVDWTDKSLSILSEQTRLLTDWWIEEMRHGRLVKLYHIAHILRAVAPNRRNDRLCGAGRGMVAVDIAGNLWPCHRFCNLSSPAEWKLGNIREGGITNHGLLERIRSLRIIGDETTACSTCPARVACHAFCLNVMVVEGKFSADCNSALPAMSYLCKIWPMFHSETMRAHHILTSENNKSYGKYYDSFRPGEKRKDAKQKLIPFCKYAKIRKEAYAKCRPCKGRKVLCQNQKNPVKEWYEKGCRPDKCKYYEAEGVDLEKPATHLV
jgi:uncharacterized protein